MIEEFNGKVPSVHPSVFVADGAVVIGNVTLEEGASLWYNSIARGDQDRVVIGKGTNVQDLCMLHVSEGNPCLLGEMVTVGHRVVIHGSKVGNGCVIGIGSILLDGSEIGEESVVAAGSVVTPGKKFPPRSFLLGTPARRLRDVTDNEVMINRAVTLKYIERAESYKKMQGSHK